jgi:hypothetical protein
MNMDNKIENHYNSFETPLRESMANMGLDIPKEHIELMLGHYPGLDRKELCVCMVFVLRYGIQITTRRIILLSNILYWREKAGICK